MAQAFQSIGLTEFLINKENFMGFLKNQFLKVIEWEDITKDTMVFKYSLEKKQVIYQI